MLIKQARIDGFDSLLNRHQLSRRNNDHQECFSLSKIMIELFPRLPRGYILHIGDSLLIGDRGQAAHWALIAISKFPQSYNVLTHSSRALKSANHYDESLTASLRAIDLEPSKSLAYKLSIKTCEELDRFVDASSLTSSGIANASEDKAWFYLRKYLLYSDLDPQEDYVLINKLIEEKLEKCLPVQQFFLSLKHSYDMRFAQRNEPVSTISSTVISLTESPRRTNWRNQQARLGKCTNFAFFDAVNSRGPCFNPSDYVAFKCSDLPLCFQEYKSIGHLGASLSHSEVWLKLDQDKGYDYGFILEDDSLLISDPCSYIYELTEVVRSSNNGRPVDMVFTGNRASRWIEHNPYNANTLCKQALVEIEKLNELTLKAQSSSRVFHGLNRAIYGGDSLFVTRTGIQKLAHFVRKHGIYHRNSYNEDLGVEKYLCDWLSKTVEQSLIQGRPNSLSDFWNAPECPYLNTYVARLPISITLSEIDLDDYASQTSSKPSI